MKFNFDDNAMVEEDLVLKEDSLDQCRSDANSICKMLDRSNIWYELVDYDMYPMNTSKVSFEVSGDWKHDHWAFKDILNDWAEENNRDIFKIDEEEIGESDSDDYVARYDVFITADKDSYNKLNSMRGLFAEGLNPREKQIYVDAVNEAEDIEDLEDICHEIYFYDKSLFAHINKRPKDGDVEKMRANMLKYLQESIKESKMFGFNYRYDIVWYNKEGKRIKFGFTNDINDAENIAIRACKHIYGMSPSNDRAQFLDSLDIEDTDNKNASAITSRVVDVKEKFLSKLENKDESLNESRALNYVVEPHKIDMGVYDIVFRNDHPHAGERAHSKRFDSYDDALKFIKRNAKYNNWVASPINEDTVKTKDGKWTNKGDEGTHGKFDTKKEADAQRKAMFANGYHESLEEDSDANNDLDILKSYLPSNIDYRQHYGRILVRKDINSFIDALTKDGWKRKTSNYVGSEVFSKNDLTINVWSSESPRVCYVKLLLDESTVPSKNNKESLKEDSDDNLKKLLNDYFRHHLSGSQVWSDVENIDKIDDNTYKVDVRFKEDFRFDIKDDDGIPYTEYEDAETYNTYIVNMKDGKVVSVKSAVNESLKESAAMDSAKKLEDDGWTVLSNGIRGSDMKHYWLARRMNKERGKADWKAIDDETGNVIDISYDQALGREPIGVSSNISNLSNKLGKMLLPKNEELKESYYKLCWYDSDPETGLYGDKFDCYAVVKAFDAKDAQEKFKDLILRTGDEQDRDRIRYFRNFTDYLQDSEMYIDDATEEEYNEYKDYQEARFESLKEDFSNFDLINYNDFLANNFDGWSDDIDDLMKEISKCARALKTVSSKLIFYVDYDEDFYAVDNIAKVVEYIGYDYSLYQLNDLSGIYFVFGSDNLCIFRNEKEASYVISQVKAAAKEMNESLQAKLDEGLLDSLEDFKEARKNWKKVVKDISFDVALERWNKESDLADPNWFAKPIYSVKAWDDMVNMFTNQDDLEEAPIEEDFDYDPDKLPDLDEIDKMEWKVDEEDGSEYIKIDEINKSVYVALGDNGYYTFLYDGNSNSITPLDDYVDSEEDAKASAKEFLKDYVEGFY